MLELAVNSILHFFPPMVPSTPKGLLNHMAHGAGLIAPYPGAAAVPFSALNCTQSWMPSTSPGIGMIEISLNVGCAASGNQMPTRCIFSLSLSARSSNLPFTLKGIFRHAP